MKVDLFWILNTKKQLPYVHM